MTIQGNNKSSYKLSYSPSFVLLFLLSLILLPGCSESWEEKVERTKWVAYSPPNSDPNKGIEAGLDDLMNDLIILKKVGFDGLVTYGASGIFGRELPDMAASLGFKAMIMGIWDPLDEEELNTAKSFAEHPLIVGYCVGNEGLNERYDYSQLYKAITNLKEATGKKVTTTEQVDDYSEASMLELGDWVFPNVHPYFHSIFDADRAIDWTMSAFEDFTNRTNKLILFKEVGYPTDGSAREGISEELQDQYYTKLEQTDVGFVYFEAFDQPWKTHLPIEPHWGLFNANRSPKLFIKRKMDRQQAMEESNKIANAASFLYIFKDANYPDNHFTPTGYMGDCGDIQLTEVHDNNVYSGSTCIKVTYTARGDLPYKCDYPGPCNWAGVYWQHPPNNWGREAIMRDKGLDLNAFKKIVFWARAEQNCMIEFKVGGIVGPFGDSQSFPASRSFNLSTEWQRFEINLEAADLSHSIGGFCWVTNKNMNRSGITFYLDEIRFES